MKAITIAIFGLSLLFCSSCDSMLDTKPQGVVSDEEGSVRGGEAYKGGSGTNDNAERNRWETFTYMQATNVGDLDNLWWVHYVAIGRIHDALRRVKALTPEEYPLKDQRLIWRKC